MSGSSPATGIGGGGSLFTNTREQWERTFNICWGGVYLGVRTFLPMLMAADEAHIVNTSSVNGFWASLGPHVSHTAYAAAKFAVKGFTEAFEKGGGKVVKDLALPFPNVEFQALLTDIAATKPDAVFTFFAGGGAVKFVKDYAAAGLKKTIPLYGSGFLTDGTLEAQGADAEGLFTALHYADSMDIPKDKSFRLAYAKTYKLQPDVYAVQGYDAAQILAVGLKATNGDISKKAEFSSAVEKNKIDSPRGAFTMSKAHNPVQDFYVRQVSDKENKLVSIGSKALADPARGCKM